MFWNKKEKGVHPYEHYLDKALETMSTRTEVEKPFSRHPRTDPKYKQKEVRQILLVNRPYAMTQAEVAKELGYSRAALNQMFRMPGITREKQGNAYRYSLKQPKDQYQWEEPVIPDENEEKQRVYCHNCGAIAGFFVEVKR